MTSFIRSLILSATSLLVCFSTDSFAQTKFRSLYVGMSVAEFSSTVGQKGLEADFRLLLLSKSLPNDYVIQNSGGSEWGLFTAAEGSLSAVTQSGDMSQMKWSNTVSADVIATNQSSITIETLKKLIGVDSFSKPSRGPSYIVDTGDSRPTSQVIFSSDLLGSDAVVSQLVMRPPYFEASAVGMADFAQSLVNNYEFVDQGLASGPSKGFNCICYVGLLKSGEGVRLEQFDSNPLNWSLFVFPTNENFKSLFQGSSPNFN